MLAKMMLLLNNWMQITLGQEGQDHRQKGKKIQRKAKVIDDLLYSSSNQVVGCHEGNCFDDLGQDVFNFKQSLNRSLKEAAPKSSKGLKCNSGSKKLNNSRPPVIIKSSGS